MKLAVVTPCFGDSCESEAGLRARRLASAFAANGHDVDVLTTASRGPAAAGEDGYTVRRFPVDRRDAKAFDRADAYLRLQSPRSARTTFPAAVTDGYAQNVRSRALLDYLADGCGDRTALLFMPYRWQPVLEGIPRVAGRAFMQPCLRREAYAFLPAVSTAIHATRGLFFGSDAEYRLALHIFGPGIRDKSVVVGEWLDEPVRLAAVVRPGGFAPEGERFVLYVGPRDETKNVGLLVAAFRSFRETHARASLKLVLAGPGTESYADPERGVLDLGPLGVAECEALLEFALVVTEPSYEVSSPSVLEAFARACPVAVNANGPWPAAFAEARSGPDLGAAGWEASTKAQWAQVFEAIEGMDRSERDRRGGAARRYFERNASVAGVLARYEGAIDGFAEPRNGVPLYHLLASNDLTDDAVRRGKALADFAGYGGMPAATGIGLAADAGTAVVVHSPETEHLRAALLGADIQALVYDTAAFVHSGREAFEVATAARTGVATSPVGAAFLQDAGVRGVREVPFLSGTRCWDVPSDRELATLLDDGKANCLYAGRLDWNAGIDRLVASFAFLLALEVDARLVLCGPLDAGDSSQTSQRNLIADSGLGDRVHFVASSDAGRMSAAFRAATIFWTLGEGATSLSPLLDAMWFDVPILAYASAPCAALLGPAGLLVGDAAGAGEVAGLAKILIGDEKVRRQVLSTQRRRREAITYDRAAGANCAHELFGVELLGAIRS